MLEKRNNNFFHGKASLYLIGFLFTSTTPFEGVLSQAQGIDKGDVSEANFWRTTLVSFKGECEAPIDSVPLQTSH